MTIRERAVGEIDFDLLVERFDSRGGRFHTYFAKTQKSS
jgi:hypothetical protein